MALVNPNIALSVKPLEIPQRNALTEAAQVMNLQQAQMQMQKMRQTDEAIERIRQAAVKNGGPGDINEIAQAFLQSPDLGHQELGLKIREQQRQKQEFETMGRKLYPQLFGAAPAAAGTAAAPATPFAPMQPGELNSGTFGMTAAPAPVTNALAPAPAAAPATSTNALVSPSGKTRQELEGIIFMAQQNPMFKGMAETAKIELAEMTKAPVYHTVPGVGLVNPRTKEVVMPSVESTPTEIKQYEYAKSQGFKGTIFDYKRALAEAGRTPAQPAAPTITTIVDPTNPNQMITIDARRYAGGGVGALGVLGVGGKEPSAALRTNKIEEGKTQLQDELDNLRGAYNTLNEARAIQSTERGALSNIVSATQGSAVGQMAGRVVGTKAQVERDVINSAKQRLVVAIKNATGMSAQQLNSNVELQTMLRSLSDPSQGYDTAMRIIGDIEDAYVKGAGMKKRVPGAETGAPPATGSSTGGWSVVR